MLLAAMCAVSLPAQKLVVDSIDPRAFRSGTLNGTPIGASAKVQFVDKVKRRGTSA